MKRLILGIFIATVTLNGDFGMISKDEAKAMWQSCDNGNLDSCKTILAIYKNRCDVDGNMAACADLGIMYSKMKDYRNALTYFHKACESEVAGSCYNLGIMYRDGYGVSIDKSKAFDYFKQVCDDGDAGGCHNLGLMYYKGEGVEQDIDEALEYLGEACDMGDDKACDTYDEIDNEVL